MTPTFIPAPGRTLLALSCVTAWMANAAQPEIALGTASTYPGTTASLPLRLTDAPDAVAAQLDVRFDPARATVQSASVAVASPGRIVRSRRLASGETRILVYSLGTTRLPGDVPLATVPVTLRSYTGSGALSISNAIVARADASVIEPLSLRGGSMEASPLQLTSDGARFVLPAQPGSSYRIQASTNFIEWLDLSTNRADADFVEAMDADAQLYPYRFYRWASLDEAPQQPSLTWASTPQSPHSLKLNAASGYTVQMSSDLERWTDIHSNAVPGDLLDLSSLLPDNTPAVFFRLRRGR